MKLGSFTFFISDRSTNITRLKSGREFNAEGIGKADIIPDSAIDSPFSEGRMAELTVLTGNQFRWISA